MEHAQGSFAGSRRSTVTAYSTPVRTVRVSNPDVPTRVTEAQVRWLCPEPDCKKPRGEPYEVVLTHYDRPGKTFTVDRWQNPCGHHDLYCDILTEAALMQQQSPAVAAASVPDNSDPAARAQGR